MKRVLLVALLCAACTTPPLKYKPPTEIFWEPNDDTECVGRVLEGTHLEVGEKQWLFVKYKEILNVYWIQDIKCNDPQREPDSARTSNAPTSMLMSERLLDSCKARKL